MEKEFSLNLKEVLTMARFTNYATLSYSGGTRDSNTVTGELVETLGITKTAVMGDYTQQEDVTYVVSLVNSGTVPIGGLTLTDNLGAYTLDTQTLYPLSYTPDSLRYYENGVLKTAPAVTAGPPLVIGPVTVPAGGNVLLIYEAEVNEYAPLGQEATVTNQVTLTGGGLAAPLTAQAVIAMEPRAELNISKGVCPATVTENGQLTYTFVIENSGSIPAEAGDQVVLTDQFQPILDPITVTFEGTAWTQGTEYTYDAATGNFATVPGKITVPAATYTQNGDGTWTVTPGTAVLVITGTV